MPRIIDGFSDSIGWTARGLASKRRSKRKTFLSFYAGELEMRQMLATFTVTSNSDSGTGSLRQIIADASGDDTSLPHIINFNTSAGGAFANTSTITLTSGVLNISGANLTDLTINGPGESLLTISGNDLSGIFQIAAPSTLNNLTLANGTGALGTSPNAKGGAIYCNSPITLNHVSITNSTADYGRGIYIDGSLASVFASSIENSICIADSGCLTLTGGRMGEPVVATSANQITVNDYNHSLELGKIVADSLNISQLSGNITQVNGTNMVVNGAANLSSPGSILLSNTSNDFMTISANGSDIAIADSTELAIESIVSTGNVTLSSLDQINLGLTGDGRITINGNGFLNVESKTSILVTAPITTQSGNISLTANGGANGSYVNKSTSGVVIGDPNNHDVRLTTQGGNIVIIGKGGGIVDSNRYGVRLYSGANITSGGSGSVEITGYGGYSCSTKSYNQGVSLADSGTRISSNGGDVRITGFGNGSGSSSYGVGVSLSGGSIITSGNNGNVTVSGTGGSGSGNYNYGVSIISGSRIGAGGMGRTEVNGRGVATSATAHGILLNGSTSSSIRSGGGLICVIGVSGSNIAGMGLKLDNSFGGTPNMSSPGGTIVIKADRIDLAANTSINATPSGTVTIYPNTSGRSINVGGADDSSNLGLSNAEINNITASTLTVGNSSAGNISISLSLSPAQSSNLTLLTGGLIRQGANITTIGTLKYSSPVLLTGNSTATGANISFCSTLNGGFAMNTVSSGSIIFNATVGNSTPLTSLSSNGPGIANLFANITTTGAQTYTSRVLIRGNSQLNTSNSSISFGNSVNGNSDLQILAGSGNVSFGAQVGTDQPLNNLTFLSANQISVAGSLNSTNIFVNSGSLDINSLFTSDLTVNGGTVNIRSGGQVTGQVNLIAGSLNSANLITGNLTVTNGTASLDTTAQLIGNANIISGSLNSANIISGSLSVNGGFVNLPISSRIYGQTFVNNGVLVNSGRLSSNLVINNGTSNLVYGSEIMGSIAMNHGNLYLNTAVSGNLTVSGGTLFTYANSTSVSSLILGNDSVWNASGSGLSNFGGITAAQATIGANASLVLTAPAMTIYQSFKLIDNTGIAPINGTFLNLAQNEAISSNGMPLVANYSGGSGGNDLVLTDTPSLLKIVAGNNQTASSNVEFGSYLTVQLLGGAGNATPVAGAHILFQMPVPVSNCSFASGYFNNDPANLTANLVTDINGNATIRIYGGVNPGPFNIQPVVTEDRSFWQTFNLGVVGLAVQKQSINRSNVRYLDLVLANPNSIPDLNSLNSNLVLRQFKTASLTGGAVMGTPSNLTLDSTNCSKTTVGWTFDFGVGGIGVGGADSTTSDGVYQVVNKPGASVTIPGYAFHRLLGDVNGDKVVDSADTALVNRLTGSLAWRYNCGLTSVPQGDYFYLASSKWVGDTNGDGRVNATDVNITTRWRGRRVSY